MDISWQASLTQPESIGSEMNYSRLNLDTRRNFDLKFQILKPKFRGYKRNVFLDRLELEELFVR
jgi:hypothetical protein